MQTTMRSGARRALCKVPGAVPLRASSTQARMEPVDPDVYHERLRDMNQRARKTVAKLVRRKATHRDVFQRHRGAMTSADMHEELQDVTAARTRERIHIDVAAEQKQRERWSAESLLEASDTLANQRGGFPWAVLGSDGVQLEKLGVDFLTYGSLRNAHALRKDTTLKPGQVMEIRKGRDGNDLCGYGVFAGGAGSSHGDTAVYPFVWCTTEQKIDGLFWNNRLRLAMERRAALLDTRSTTAFRLVNGAQDQMPGLYVDVVGDAATIKLFPEGSRLISAVVPFLVDDLQIQHIYVTDMGSGHQLTKRSAWLDAAVGEDVTYLENGVTLGFSTTEATALGGFNWMLHRPSRALLKSISAGKTVLDLYCGTGGFAAHALAGGAAYVDAVDEAKLRCEQARRNLALNDPEKKGNYAVHRQKARYFLQNPDGTVKSELLGKYDLIMVDPEQSVATQAARRKGRDRIEFEELGLVVTQWVTPMRMVADGGYIMAMIYEKNMSHEEFWFTLQKAARVAGRRVQAIRGLTGAADFVELLSGTRSADRRLKGYLLRVKGRPQPGKPSNTMSRVDHEVADGEPHDDAAPIETPPRATGEADADADDAAPVSAKAA